MDGKRKTKQKHLSKASLKNGTQSSTIIEMFKKQSERKSRQSENGSTVIDIDDDDDVVFIEESVASPYFNKSLNSETNKSAKASSECPPESKETSSVRKRKLSLARIDRVFNSKSTSSSEPSSHETLSGGKDIRQNCNKIDKTSISGKLTKSEKRCIENELPTDNTNHKQKNRQISSVKKKLRSATMIDENLLKNSDTIFINDTSSTSCTAGTASTGSSSSDMDLDIRYSPVFPQHVDSMLNNSTVNMNTTYKCKTNSNNVHNGEQNNDSTRKTDIEQPIVHEGDNSARKIDNELPEVDDDDNDSVHGDDSTAGESKFKVPYYLNSFETLMQVVMDDETNKNLFNEGDLHSIAIYQQLSDGAKKLYIRMFGRKLHWIPLSKLKYSEIAEDLKPYLQELTKAALLDCDEHMTDLEDVLNALSASDIKALAKSYHITSNINQKRQLVQELLKKSQQSTLTTMFGFAGKNVAKDMLTRAKKYLDGIYRLRTEPRGVFVRVMMLFSLVNTLVDEDSGTSGQGQLFQMLMVNMGKLVYPTYTIEKVHCVYQDREDLIRFENALQLESDLLHCIERKNWEKAYTVFKSIEEEWSLLKGNESITEWNKNLPDFLRCFTATSVVNRLLSASVEILQRRKDYSGAIELLQKLLSETTYNCSHRGYLWERLALNLDAHMKQPLESLEAVQNGLADTYVYVGHRLALYLRAESICQRPKLKLQHRLKEFHHEIVKETPKVYIEGRVLHQDVSTNGTRFLADESFIDGNSQDMTVMGVEEYVLHYYKRNGFPSGIHAEGSIVSTFFALFFWDILFMSVPDAFHGPFQTMPLDLHSKMFYDRRKMCIEERLGKLMKSSVQELQTIAEETWTSQQGIVCAGLNWDLMSLDCIKELLFCMGGKVLSGIVGRYARSPRHTRSGFPDLTLWNAGTGTLKICEVKGPGDRLSNKQILWIDYLVKLGIDAEVCHVKAVAAKKLRPLQQ